MVLPTKVWGNVFPRKAFHGRTKASLGQKKYGEIVLNTNSRTNDQIMAMLDRTFINDKSIFQ